MDLDLTQDSVDTESIEGSDSDSEEGIQSLDLGECEIIDELDLWELEQIPHAMVKEGQILEGFMLEEEIEFQDIDRYEKVELLDGQYIEECINREKCAMKSLEIPLRMACEQEECMEIEILIGFYQNCQHCI